MTVLTDPLVLQLIDACDGPVRAQASLAELSTLRVGGPARALVTAESDNDLAIVGRACREHGVPWAVIGRGSNLLVSDHGWPGVAIQLGTRFRGVEVDGERVRAGAAEKLPVLAVRVADAGLTGFAWACAVPGSLGGAVRMNAGAHGGDMAKHLVEVEIVRLRTGIRETWPAPTLGLGYRSSALPDDAVVVAATLSLVPGEADAVREEIRSIRAWRRAHQPLNEPNCGSVFTNPVDGSAGRLIDEAGLKGRRVGGAQVSTRHANFIVTRAGATAADVATLIRTVQDGVRAASGIDLVPEVARLGVFDPADTTIDTGPADEVAEARGVVGR
jgi:UDP-N-acetylmuramate dehydrogenase